MKVYKNEINRQKSDHKKSETQRKPRTHTTLILHVFSLKLLQWPRNDEEDAWYKLVRESVSFFTKKFFYSRYGIINASIKTWSVVHRTFLAV